MIPVRVIKPSRIRQHAKDYPDAKMALLGWLRIARRASWGSLQDVRKDMPHADGVDVYSGRTVTVFNIGGNKYRLITSIVYRSYTVYVLRFLTHKEYNTEKYKEQL